MEQCEGKVRRQKFSEEVIRVINLAESACLPLSNFRNDKNGLLIECLWEAFYTTMNIEHKYNAIQPSQNKTVQSNLLT